MTNTLLDQDEDPTQAVRVVRPLELEMASVTLSESFQETAANTDSELPALMDPRPRARLHWLMKRFCDILFVFVFTSLFWWLFVIAAVGVRVSGGPGPLVFGHTRVGRFGRKFKCYKFRSMVSNASEVLEDLLSKDFEARREWEQNFKLKNDPRITAWGNFLRRTSLDELPQLWNILMGEMSVVGPRPVTRQELRLHYGEGIRAYVSLCPGLTGPWQVNGRSDTTYAERVAMDRDYVLDWTIRGDFMILMRTIGVVFGRKGAY